MPVRVWDVPTRMFHWLIVGLFGLSWLSASRGWMDLHFLSGYSIIALLLFRLSWGFVGSETSRFVHFIRSPLAVRQQLARLHRREPDTTIGHNAAGGWMVMLILALLVVQVATGLCANDDGYTEGPLLKYVGKDWSDWLSHIHAVNFTVIKAVIALHMLAILAYYVLKRHNLVWPMITGRKRLPPGTIAPTLANPLRAAVLLVIAAGLVGVAVNVL